MRKMIKFAIIIAFIFLSCCTACAAGRENKPTYKTTVTKDSKFTTRFYVRNRLFCTIKTDNPPTVKYIKSENLTRKKLLNRKRATIIYVEILNGKVINRKGDGKTKAGYYISYKNIPGIRKGSSVKSYLVHNPNNSSFDSIEGRCDYIVKK